MTAEAEGITHRILNVALLSFSESVVEIQFLLTGKRIPRQVNIALCHCADADDCFDRAGASEEMSGHGFCGVDGDLLRIFSHRVFDRARLVKVI